MNLILSRVLPLTVCLALVAGFVSAAGFSSDVTSGPGLVVPQWRRGDRWLVAGHWNEARSAVADGAAADGPLWGKTSVWLYRVAAVKDMGDYRLFNILVRNWKTPPTAQASLIFLGRLNATGDKVISLFLYKAFFRKPDGEDFSRDFSARPVGGHPVLNDFSIIPFGFPFFDNGVPAGLDARRTFMVSQKVGVIYLARDVIQEVVTPPKGRLSKIAFKLKHAPKMENCLLTSFFRPSDDFFTMQLWHAGYPWPLYSESRNVRAWLVKLGKKLRKRHRRRRRRRRRRP